MREFMPPNDRASALLWQCNIMDEVSFLLNKLAIAAWKVDIDADRVTVLSNQQRPFENGLEFKWTNYTLNCLHGLFPNNPSVRRRLTIGGLKQMLLSARLDQKVFTEEVLHNSDNRILKLDIFFERIDGRYFAFMTLKEVNSQSILQAIVDNFVFMNCDYFIVANIADDYFTTIYGSERCPSLPPLEGKYSYEIVQYARRSVVPQDQDYVITRMGLQYAVQELQNQDAYSFYFGVIENDLYTRKKLEFRYLDDSKNTLLLARSDITESYNQDLYRVQELKALLKSAYHDALSGLLNRQGLYEQLKARCESGKSEIDLALLFIDLDNFKAVNDSLGHPIGDRVLIKTAQVLKNNMRSMEDLAARQGGDEFIVVMFNIESNAAYNAAERILQGIEAIVPDELSPLRVSCSIGIAMLSECTQDLEKLFSLADERMYSAKRQGKGRIVVA